MKIAPPSTEKKENGIVCREWTGIGRNRRKIMEQSEGNGLESVEAEEREWYGLEGNGQELVDMKGRVRKRDR